MLIFLNINFGNGKALNSTFSEFIMKLCFFFAKITLNSSSEKFAFLMASINIGETLDPCVLDILKSNNTIPAIWLGANGELKAHRNLNTKEIQLKKIIKGQEKKLVDSSKIKLLKFILTRLKNT